MPRPNPRSEIRCENTQLVPTPPLSRRSRGNTLSLEMFEHAVTPAFLGFYATHGERFDAWQRGEGRGAVSPDAKISQQGAEAALNGPGPLVPDRSAPQPRKRKAKAAGQLNLFD
jgi:hypothetical protein